MNYSSLSNEELLWRAQQEGGAACDAAYRRFFPLVTLSAARLLSTEDAQELGAEIVSRIVLKRPPEKRIEHVAAYLARAARNGALRLLKYKSKREDAQQLYAANFISVLDVESTLEQTLDTEGYKRRYGRLYAAMDQLSPHQRESLTLFFFGDYSYKEIARITDRTVMQVKSAIQNGKIRLYNLLEHSAL